MIWNVAFLVIMAALEYGQALVDLIHHNYPRAVIMVGAGTSSLAMIYIGPSL